MNIPIKKHTKVRRPMSNYRVDQYGSYERVGSFTELTQQASAIVVTDISIGLENPLILLPGMYKDWCAK